MDEGKLRNQESRGERAKLLLENELLKEGFEKIHEALIQSWKESKPDEKERRDDAWRSLKLLEKLQSELTRIVRTGKDAKTRLLEIKPKGIF